MRRLRKLDANADIQGMCCNAQADELFLADWGNRAVRATRVRANAGADDVRHVYRGSAHDTSPAVYSVCHMRDSDTLLVCSYERGQDYKNANWLVALSRRGGGDEWRETHRLQTEHPATICCALSDSRVLIGKHSSEYLQQFRVQSGPRIADEQRIRVPEKYEWLSATCGSGGETHVAMSFEKDQSVRVFRLVGDRLDERARIQLESPYQLLWLAARLFVGVSGGNGVVELALSGKRLERRAQLKAVRVNEWCALDDGVVVYNAKSKELLHYSLT